MKNSRKLFVGTSEKGGIDDALQDAVVRAKAGMAANFVDWSLSFVSGQNGGIAGRNAVRVGILAAPAGAALDSAAAYFEMTDGFPNPYPFFIKLTDPDKIATARKILSGQKTDELSVRGTIVKETAPYNEPWSYHLDPETIEFFDMAIEVCDASIQYVEDNIGAAGGAFLPDCHWCPWTSTLVREVEG